MDKENQNTSENQQEQGQVDNTNTENQNNSQDEKKYSDSQVNDIVKSKSEKAVSKALKELGFTDMQQAKDALAGAQQSKKPETKDNSPDVSAQLQEAIADKNRAIIENIFLTRQADPKKLEKAVKLIDLKACQDEKGNLDRQKAETAVDELLKEWPEIKSGDVSNAQGFIIGSDGEQGSGKNTQQKAPAKKSWNRFN